MFGREQLLSISVSAGMLVCTPVIVPGFSTTLRLPIHQPQAGARLADGGGTVGSPFRPPPPPVTSRRVSDDVFTTADAAVLDLVSRAASGSDDVDYSTLLEYEDD